MEVSGHDLTLGSVGIEWPWLNFSARWRWVAMT